MFFLIGNLKGGFDPSRPWSQIQVEVFLFYLWCHSSTNEKKSSNLKGIKACFPFGVIFICAITFFCAWFSARWEKASLHFDITEQRLFKTADACKIASYQMLNDCFFSKWKKKRVELKTNPLIFQVMVCIIMCTHVHRLKTHAHLKNEVQCKTVFREHYTFFFSDFWTKLNVYNIIYLFKWVWLKRNPKVSSKVLFNGHPLFNAPLWLKACLKN